MSTALLLEQTSTADATRPRQVYYQTGIMTFHADSQDTDGRFALLEFQGKPGGEPPMHVHQREDELFYLLEGRLKVFRGSEEISVLPGQSVLLPRGIPHTFKILSPEVRGLVYISPGGFEGFFRELGTPVSELEIKAIGIPQVIETGLRYGITILPQN